MFYAFNLLLLCTVTLTLANHYTETQPRSDWFQRLLLRSTMKKTVKRSIAAAQQQRQHRIQSVMDEPVIQDIPKQPSLLTAVAPPPSEIGAISKFYFEHNEPNSDYGDAGKLEVNVIPILPVLQHTDAGSIPVHQHTDAARMPVDQHSKGHFQHLPEQHHKEHFQHQEQNFLKSLKSQKEDARIDLLYYDTGMSVDQPEAEQLTGPDTSGSFNLDNESGGDDSGIVPPDDYSCAGKSFENIHFCVVFCTQILILLVVCRSLYQFS